MPIVLAVPIAALLSAAFPPQVEDPLLANLLAEAAQASPAIQAAQAELDAARARPAQARARPDPTVGLAFTNEGLAPRLGSTPDSALEVMVAQDLPYPGKRRLRGRLAELDAVAAEQRLARARLAVAASVRRAYHGLLAARALRDITTEQAALWEQTEGVARARYGVGQGSQQDVLRSQVEITRVQQLAAAQESEVAIRLAELNGLLARPATAPLETDPSALGTPEVPDGLDAVFARLSEDSPELRAARTWHERAEVAIELAGREYRPDFGVQAAYMNRGGLDPMWRAGVTVTLPLARERRRGAVAEAEAEKEAARARVEAVALQLRFRTQERLAQLDAARRIATLYAEGVIPQDRMSVEAAIATYQAGRVPFVTVLEAVATLYNDRATRVRVLAGSQQTLAALEEASLESSPDLPALGAAGAGASMSASPAATGGMAR